jgi:hypothetical protein
MIGALPRLRRVLLRQAMMRRRLRESYTPTRSSSARSESDRLPASPGSFSSKLCASARSRIRLDRRCAELRVEEVRGREDAKGHVLQDDELGAPDRLVEIGVGRELDRGLPRA